LIALNGHLLVEERINILLKKELPNPKTLARVATTPSQSVNDTNPIPAQLISMSPCAPKYADASKSWSRVDRLCMTLRSMERRPGLPNTSTR
jgi:hypothetical protein